MRPSTFYDDYLCIKPIIYEFIIYLVPGFIAVTICVALVFFYTAIILEYLTGGEIIVKCPVGYTEIGMTRKCISKEMIVKPNITKSSIHPQFKHMLGWQLYDLLISPFIIVPLATGLITLAYFASRCKTMYYNSYLRVKLVNANKKEKISDV